MGTVEMETQATLVALWARLARTWPGVGAGIRGLLLFLDSAAAAIVRAVINARRATSGIAGEWCGGFPGHLDGRGLSAVRGIRQCTRERIESRQLEWKRYRLYCKQSAGELRVVADIISNRLSQLSFDALIMQFAGDKRVRRLKLVKWADLQYTPDQYRLQVDSLTLPRGRGITEDAMSKPDVVRSLSASVQKPVTAHFVDGVGLWFLVDRQHGYGNIPKFCDYAAICNQADARKPINVPIGFGSGRKVIYVDFSDEKSAHLLIGGTTGGGKSTLLHLLICHLIQQSPGLVRLSLFDFKRVAFRSYYRHVPHKIRMSASTKQPAPMMVSSALDVLTLAKIMRPGQGHKAGAPPESISKKMWLTRPQKT